MACSRAPLSERLLMICFLVVDLGFLAYWAITALHALPPEWLYSEYADPLMVAWNWSFLPLDLAVSATGLTAVALRRHGSAHWQRWALVSLALTSASGFQAISFWALRCDLDLGWWVPNSFLLLYPWGFLPRLLCGGAAAGRVPSGV